MLLGNRPRPQMQRTASITRITIEVDDDQTAGQDSDVAMTVVDGGDNYDQRFLGVLSPVNHRRNERKDGGRSSPSSLSSFLGNCGFCKRRLAPGRDIYMYKGDAAFCSIECREQQMEHDEGKTRNRVVLSPSN
ncbi:Zf-FLZ domain [Arabidopsis suecica]|uniref:Zf-FLZ domain n=1 Tax=Arabidopsis suecica TaxID=45249 RepID=A0A8T1YET8_ARASU|nr:Zf-FLZ domain [Arabidopsis suecica]